MHARQVDHLSLFIKEKMRKTGMFLFVTSLLAASLLAACGGAAAPNTNLSNSGAPLTAGQATSVPQVGVPTAPAVPASARDVNSMNACALFPGDKVASALNTSLVDPTNKGAGIATNCTYFLKPAGAGSGTGQLYNLFLAIPKLFDPSLTALENPQPVAGLGDKAFMGTRVGTTLKDLMVLKTGDIFIEVNGDDASMLQKLAEYVLANLP